VAEVEHPGARGATALVGTVTVLTRLELALDFSGDQGPRVVSPATMGQEVPDGDRLGGHFCRQVLPTNFVHLRRQIGGGELIPTIEVRPSVDPTVVRIVSNSDEY
jgi:hypothetical protein